MSESIWMKVVLPLWGAGLATILAGFRLWEFWRDRSRIEICPYLTSSEEEGNDIRIRNVSKTPIIIGYWELQWLSGRWPFRKVSERLPAEPDADDVRIEAHSTRTLNFSEADHFDWSVKSLKGRTIYLKLQVAGRRRPILRKVYPL